VWLVGHFGVSPIVSLGAGLPVASGDFTFPLPSLGSVGFLAALTTQSSGLLCTDFDTVNTGFPGVSASRVQELIEELKTQLLEEAAPQ
jgi:hypothetical protein